MILIEKKHIITNTFVYIWNLLNILFIGDDKNEKIRFMIKLSMPMYFTRMSNLTKFEKPG